MSILPGKLLTDLHTVADFDEQAFIAAHQQQPVTSVRLHPVKNAPVFADAPQVPWCPSGRYLSERPVFTTDPFYHGGAYYVQEASSMFLDYILRQIVAEKKHLRVLDLCAAPGGKSTLLASFLNGEGLLISNEVIRTRASILEENMARWGYMNTWVTSNDPRDFSRLPGYFDVAVVDAPCSGSGLFRKDERALQEWSEANVQLCSQRQQRILADIWPALKGNGILIYATCSYSPQEDEQLLDWLAKTFEVSSIQVSIPREWHIVTTTTTRGMTGYRFFPDKVKGEGFFIAALRKKNAEDTLRTPKFKSIHNKKIAEQASYLLQPGDYCYLSTNKDEYCAINPQHEADYHLLQKALYLRKTGLTVGSPAAKDWLPAHEIALSIDAAKDLPIVPVNKEQALHFLKKEDIAIPLEKGWYIISYQGVGLGWIKSLGTRINNYLPKNWRIRMEITDADWA